MIKWLALALVTAVAWYVWNAARLTWREGNSGGAVVIGVAALFTFGLPTFLLFFWGE